MLTLYEQVIDINGSHTSLFFRNLYRGLVKCSKLLWLEIHNDLALTTHLRFLGSQPIDCPMNIHQQWYCNKTVPGINYFTSSDPHHDMSGGGCQVRVVNFYLYQQSKHMQRSCSSAFMQINLLLIVPRFCNSAMIRGELEPAQ